MAIDAKVSFINQIQKRLSCEATVDMMTKILSIVSDTLESFDMREITAADDQDDMLDCFLQAMTVQGRSKKTVEHYRRVLRRMLDGVGVSTRKVTVHHLRGYIAKLQKLGRKDSTLEGYRQVYSAFFGWLHREGLIDRNPVANLGAIKVAKVEKKIFSDIEMEKLRVHCENIRDKAIVAFLASTGCRVAELVELNLDTVDLVNLECVVHGKGDKERTVYIDTVTAMYLRNYLATRKDNSNVLFTNRYGERFETGGIREMLKRLEAVSGVENVHPHRFRRTLATNMAKRGMPIQTIAAILGHEKIETTMRYIVMNKEGVKLQYRQYYAC